ncbi:tripartite motif-containing protein 2-like [Dysidea avara]|uniref:tripartite motif-containing protein 2-like n=1 Tax=Dysidea avara TaxID=196820 RepID=UPI003320F663
MAENLKRTTENLSCPVCFNLFKSPRYLPCHHSYCEGCLEKMQVQSKIICPECRKEAKVPAGGVKEFATNFFINKLVDDLILRRTKSEAKVTCNECGDDEIAAFCPSCNSFLCPVCSSIHKEKQTCQSNDTVSLTASISSIQSGFICEKHDYELKHYCETCGTLVCLYCTQKEHNGHDHDMVKNVAGKHRNGLKKLAATISEMNNSVSNACRIVNNLQEKIKEEENEINEKIDQHYDELFQQLTKQKQLLKEELFVAISQIGLKLMTRLTEVEGVQAEICRVQELNDDVEKSSDQEVLSTEHILIDNMDSVCKLYKRLHLPILEPDNMVSFVSNEKVFGQLYALGKPFSLADATKSEVEKYPSYTFKGDTVNLKIVSKDQTGHNCSLGGNKVCVQLESTNGELTAVEVKDNNDGIYVASFISKQIGKATVSVFVNGEHVQGSAHTFTVYRNYHALNKASKTIGDDCKAKFGSLWGITFCYDGTWAVTDNSNHCVYVFYGQDQLIRKYGGKGGSKGQFQSPRGISCDQSNNLYVADYCNHRIQKFNNSGEYLLQFNGHKLFGFYKMNFPTGVTTHNNKVYVAEKSDKGCVSVFDSTGQFCFTVGSKELTDPCDVAVNCLHHLLVLDCSQNCVYTFTLDGSCLQKFSSGGNGVGKLNSPCSLATDVNLFIFVADTWNNRVSVFDKDGNCVHCFGSKGSASDQLSRPHGIALDSEERLYICDYSNFRIQIF